MAERIRLKQRKARISFAKGEMRKVISDKCEHDQPTHHHVTGGERCFDVALVHVGLGPGTAILNCQLDGHVDVDDNRGQQEQTN